MYTCVSEAFIVKSTKTKGVVSLSCSEWNKSLPSHFQIQKY